jgi:HAD superfamily hydrolase (TIGR01509 family)
MGAGGRPKGDRPPGHHSWIEMVSGMSLAGDEADFKRFDALLFDVDGTMAETEEFHRRAFNETFAYFELPWVWDVKTYGQLLRVTGGKERIRHFSRWLSDDHRQLSDGQIEELHRFKTQCYANLINRGACKLRQGVSEMIRQATIYGQRLAIVTTTSRENIDALLRVNLGPSWKENFPVVIAGEDVPKKKPAPDAYLKALELLGLEPRSCLAIEDSRNGLVAATDAGVPVLVTRSLYFRDDDFSEALRVVDNLTELADLGIALDCSSPSPA